MFIIGLDASSANKQHKTGVEWYAYHLIQHLKKHALKSDERVLLYAPEALRGALGNLPAGWQERVLSWPLSRGWMQGRMSFEMLRQRPDLLFVPSQALPRFLGKKTVTTIHDIGWRERPDLYEGRERQKLEWATADAVKRANRIITPSPATKEALGRHYSVDAEKIAVTPLAVDFGVFRTCRANETRAVREELGIDQPYFLFVGRLEAKKNIKTLIQAFDQYCAGSGPVMNLVLVGHPGFGYLEIEKAIGLSPNKNLIKRPGYLQSDKINALLSGASAFCFPSWIEGFGLPNLEAMAAGAPLIVSDIAAHREVVGNAGLFVAPDDAAAWARALERVVSNPHLANQLVERGHERVRDYSWSRTAERTWEIFRRNLEFGI